MNRMIVAAFLAAAALTLAGCGKKTDPNMPSAEENAGLANAGAMDTSPDSLVPSDNATLGNEEDGDEEEGNEA
jgi:predicted small lipoprotein YifL